MDNDSEIGRLEHELKAARERLAGNREALRAILANAPGAVYRCLYDQVWTMLFMSPSIQDITGYPAQEFTHNMLRAYSDVIHPGDARPVAHDVAAGVEEQRPFELEYRILHASGQVRWCYEKGWAVYDENGTPQWLEGVILDITEFKALAQQLADSEHNSSP